MRMLAAALTILFALSLVALTPAPTEARRRDSAQAWGCQIWVSIPWFVKRSRARDGSLLGPRVVISARAQCERKTRWDVAVLRLYRVRAGMKDEIVAVRRGGRLDPTEVWIWGLDLATPCRKRWTVSLPKLYARAVFKKRGETKRVVVTSRAWNPDREKTCLDHQ